MARTLAACLILCLPLTVRAGDDDPTLEVLDQAIRAHGGEKNLARVRMAVRTSQGVTTAFGKDIAFAEELVMQLPDRFRQTIELGGGQKGRLLRVLNGDKGWQSSGGPAMEMGAESLRELRDELAVRRLATLTPLTRGEFKLAPLPEVKVNGEPAVGVKAAQGKTEMKLYFDKKTHLLVKIERRASEGGRMIDKEYVFGDHKEFDGVTLPTKEVVLINGRKFSEEAGMTYKMPRKIDDALFGKP